MNETLTLLTKVLPQLALIAALSGFFGWSLRGLSRKPAPTRATPVADKSQQDRVKTLEAALEKAKAAHKSLKAELESLQAASVAKAVFDATAAELGAARESSTKRIATLEAELKKAQDTVKSLNSRANEADKIQKDRSFALENELSKIREELAVLQARPDDTAGLEAEIERLRESVAVSTRFAGEMRKREAVALEALEKAEGRLVGISDSSRPAAAAVQKIGPVGDSDRVAAAKAEVIRLVELNRQNTAAAAVELATPAAE